MSIQIIWISVRNLLKQHSIHQPWLNDSHPFNNSRVGDEYLLNLKKPDIQYALFTADVAMKKEKLLAFPCFNYRTVS
jgi:hypothetical protein